MNGGARSNAVQWTKRLAMTAPALPDMAQAEIVIVEMTNDFRRKNNRQPVMTDTKLTQAARAFAAYLARTGTFAHDADGRQPSERATIAGYAHCFIAENIAYNQSSAGFETRDLAQRMVEGWINSPGHRQNMLAEHAADTAVAIARGPDKDPKFIAVQLFARPRSLAYEFQISNSSSEVVRYIFAGKTHEVKPNLGVVHTACLPGQVTFEGTAARPGNPPASSFEASDGLVFELRKAPAGYRVEMRRKERIN